MKEIDQKVWSLKRELRYFENLGTFSEAGARAGKDILQSKYLETFDKRTNWGGLDKKKLYFAIVDSTIASGK